MRKTADKAATGLWQNDAAEDEEGDGSLGSIGLALGGRRVRKRKAGGAGNGLAGQVSSRARKRRAAAPSVTAEGDGPVSDETLAEMEADAEEIFREYEAARVVIEQARSRRRANGQA